jgi:hypothetical protein
MFKITILESDKQIQNTINQLLAQQVKKILPGITQSASQFIKNKIIESIKNQPEYISLLSGKLKYEFGLPDADSRVSAILSAISNSIQINTSQPTYNSSGVKGGFVINMVKSDFSDIVNLPEAVFQTEKGSYLQWLKWLLLEGDNSIVFGYTFLLGQNPYSRTGQGIMKSDMSGVWRVPPEFAGTLDNNWITRAITATEPEINNYLKNLFK